MSSHSQAPIVLDSIETRFGSSVIHRGVSLTLESGRIVALIGGSGAGKSVLLRVALGLLRPSAGQVRLFGHDIWQLSEAELNDLRNRIGVLFQNGALFSGLTVAQNVAVPLQERTKLSAELVDQVVDLRLALSGLTRESRYKMPSELSGGMVKRAALARAIALEPEVLFLDEPTSGLDPINARAFDQLVRTLCDSLKLTVVMVTHDLDTLFSIVDRIVVLGEGKILADGPLDVVVNTKHSWIQQYFSSRVA